MSVVGRLNFDYSVYSVKGKPSWIRRPVAAKWVSSKSAEDWSTVNVDILTVHLIANRVHNRKELVCHWGVAEISRISTLAQLDRGIQSRNAPLRRSRSIEDGGKTRINESKLESQVCVCIEEGVWSSLADHCFDINFKLSSIGKLRRVNGKCALRRVSRSCHKS